MKNRLLLIIFERKRQGKLSTRIQIEFEYWTVCGATWKQQGGRNSREASVCLTIGVSRRSPRGKSRISLRSDAFPPDSWPALGLRLADGRGIASMPAPRYRYAAPFDTLTRSVIMVLAYPAAIQVGSCPSRNPCDRAGFNSRPLIVATRFIRHKHVRMFTRQRDARNDS